MVSGGTATFSLTLAMGVGEWLALCSEYFILKKRTPWPVSQEAVWAQSWSGCCGEKRTVTAGNHIMIRQSSTQ